MLQEIIGTKQTPQGNPAQVSPAILADYDNKGSTVLHELARCGYEHAFKDILAMASKFADTLPWEGGIDPVTLSMENMLRPTLTDDTILHSAARGRTPSLVKFCCDQKIIDVNACNSDQMTALHIAAENEDLETVEILISYMSEEARSTPNKDGETPLMIALDIGNSEIASKLLEGFQIDGMSAQRIVHTAAEQGRAFT